MFLGHCTYLVLLTRYCSFSVLLLAYFLNFEIFQCSGLRTQFWGLFSPVFIPTSLMTSSIHMVLNNIYTLMMMAKFWFIESNFLLKSRLVYLTTYWNFHWKSQRHVKNNIWILFPNIFLLQCSPSQWTPSLVHQCCPSQKSWQLPWILCSLSLKSLLQTIRNSTSCTVKIGPKSYHF